MSKKCLILNSLQLATSLDVYRKQSMQAILKMCFTILGSVKIVNQIHQLRMGENHEYQTHNDLHLYALYISRTNITNQSHHYYLPITRPNLHCIELQIVQDMLNIYSGLNEGIQSINPIEQILNYTQSIIQFNINHNISPIFQVSTVIR